MDVLTFFIISASGVRYRWWSALALMLEMDVVGSVLLVTTGVHTQNIESYWNRVKKRFKSMKGVHSHQLASYLDEFMWRE